MPTPISRVSTLRLASAALRTSGSRRTAAALPRQCARPTAPSRRGYATSHGAAHGPGQGSDMPWLISSVAVTAVGLAFILSPSSSSAPKGHSSHAEEHKEEAEPPTPHDESSSEEKKEEAPQEGDQKQQEASSEGKGEEAEDKSAGESSDPSAKHKSSQTGSQVPPPPADNADLAENREARKEGHEDYKQTIEDKQTRVASSSSTTPSKKTTAENPREDPQKGEGEGVQKGGPSSSSS